MTKNKIESAILQKMTALLESILNRLASLEAAVKPPRLPGVLGEMDPVELVDMAEQIRKFSPPVVDRDPNYYPGKVTDCADGSVWGPAGSIWNEYTADAAQAEGWDLFHHTGMGVLEIEVIACPCDVPVLADRGITEPLFENDSAVTHHCIARAREGSRLHALALYLDGRPPELATWVPSELLPERTNNVGAENRSGDGSSGADAERGAEPGDPAAPGSPEKVGRDDGHGLPGAEGGGHGGGGGPETYRGPDGAAGFGR